MGGRIHQRFRIGTQTGARPPRLEAEREVWGRDGVEQDGRIEAGLRHAALPATGHPELVGPDRSPIATPGRDAVDGVLRRAAEDQDAPAVPAPDEPCESLSGLVPFHREGSMIAVGPLGPSAEPHAGRLAPDELLGIVPVPGLGHAHPPDGHLFRPRFFSSGAWARNSKETSAGLTVALVRR